jgi:DnaJ-domain-containing protein 1
LAQGLVVGVEVDGASPSLAEILRRERAVGDDILRRSLLRAIASHRLHGEVLVDDFRLSAHVIGRALRRQIVVRLAALEALADARVVFRVAVRPPRWSLQGSPLDPREFLHGRRRARERTCAEPEPRIDTTAWHVLGISPGTELADIKRAYRRLARTVHPDLFPTATDDQRRALQTRFIEITEAYRTLVA